MTKRDISEPDLDRFLKQTFRDDIPPEAEARMNRHFRHFENNLAQQDAQAGPHRGLWGRGIFRKEIMAFASAALLIAGAVMHLSGNQSVLAHSIAGVKTVVTVSSRLLRVASMDCMILKRDAGNDPYSCRVRWDASGISRVDLNASTGEKRTLWIPDGAGPRALYESLAARSTSIQAMPADPMWQPALEFLTPAILAEHLESRYGLVRALHQHEAERNQVLLVGLDNQQAVEVAVDVATYLPITIKKYRQDSRPAGGGRACLEEIRFQWNQPIPKELLLPKFAAGSKSVN
ncbi:MAG TPA: hypothetical protein VMG30_19090 [Acidobacteriota bacterium]|nr:hypothetical protein [Acidobacteriota bacterium]